MENKKLYIGLGVLAVAGIGYYMWKKNKSEIKSNATAEDKKKKKKKTTSNSNQSTAAYTKSLYE